MTYPTPYERQYDFQSYQNANPNKPLPADKANVEFNAVEESIGEVIDFIENFARSDGAIANGVIGWDQIDAGLKLYFTGDTVAEILDLIATQADAEAGTSNGVLMTPLRVTQALTALLATQAEAEAGTDNTKIMTPLRGAQQVASFILDEDDFATDSATKAPSQQSTAAYIATQIGKVLNTGITRSQIGSTSWAASVDGIVLAGYSSVGDAGHGAVYARGDTGFLPIEDAAGNWWSIPSTIPVMEAGWWGCHGNGTDDEFAAWMGADGTGATTGFVADCIARMVSQSSGVAIHVPGGIHRVSGTINFSQMWRANVIFDGEFRPYSSFSDYLFTITNSASDPIVPALAGSVRMLGLKIDGEWKSRGAKLHQLYSSNYHDIKIIRTWGNSLKITGGQEVNFFGLRVEYFKPRNDSTITGAATAWSSSNNYAVGDYVYYKAPAYASGTTYAVGAIVSDSSYNYVSTKSSNLGNALSDAGSWLRVPMWLFFQCVQAHTSATPKCPCDGPYTTASSPGTDYTRRSTSDGTGSGVYWEQVNPYEVPFEITHQSNAAQVSNFRFWGLIFRACESITNILVWNPHDQSVPTELLFEGMHNHVITSQYITAFNGSTAYTTPYGAADTVTNIVARTDTGSHSIWFMHVSRPNIGKSLIRPGDYQGCYSLVWGSLGVSTSVNRVHTENNFFDGTGAATGRVAQFVLPDCAVGATSWYQTADEYIGYTGSTNYGKFDPTGCASFWQSGSTVLTAGSGTIAVTFSQPLAQTPRITLRGRTVTSGQYLRGLVPQVESVSKTGFTIRVSGVYLGNPQTKSFTSGGGTNQSATYAHSFGVQNDSILAGAPSADVGAGFYLIEGASDANNAILKAPAAPSNTATVPWRACWSNKAPHDITFDWEADASYRS